MDSPGAFVSGRYRKSERDWRSGKKDRWGSSTLFAALPHRADRVGDAAADPEDQGIEAGDRVEDAGVLAFVGLAPIADIGGHLAEIAFKLGLLHFRKDGGELAHRVVDLEV